MAAQPISLLQVFLLCTYSWYLPTNPRYHTFETWCVYCFRPWNNKTICLSVCTPFGVDFPILFELDPCFRFRIDSTLSTWYPALCVRIPALPISTVSQFWNHTTYLSLLAIPPFHLSDHCILFWAINLFFRRLKYAFSKRSKEPERQMPPAGLRMVQSSPFQLCNLRAYSPYLIIIEEFI